MVALMHSVERAARGNAKVLITGESGVGKDVVARHIHSQLARALAPFVAVNCAGVTETLLESELFGHVKGSFTGAYRDKRGKLQLAHRGTLFLDEVGEMSLRMQALLLRFLENGEIQAVGSDPSQARVDVRVIAATNRNLTSSSPPASSARTSLPAARHPPPRAAAPGAARGRHALVRHFLAARPRPSTLHRRGAAALLQRYHGPATSASSRTSSNSSSGCAPATSWSRAPGLPVSSPPPATGFRRERRRQPADELYDALVSRGSSFWEHVYPMFLARDITRHDLRELVHRGLVTTNGNYRSMLRLFGMSEDDYKRLLNFLAAHDCSVDVRAYREGAPPPSRARAPFVAAAVAAPGEPE